MSSASKIALFIDGANLYSTGKALGFDIDYRRLRKEFQSRGTLVRAFYYTAIIEDQEYSSLRPLIDWLDYNGYTVVTKATKEFIDASGRRKVKGNMDIELAVAAMEMAAHIDHMVLFSGGNFNLIDFAISCFVGGCRLHLFSRAWGPVALAAVDGSRCCVSRTGDALGYEYWGSTYFADLPISLSCGCVGVESVDQPRS